MIKINLLGDDTARDNAGIMFAGGFAASVVALLVVFFVAHSSISSDIEAKSVEVASLENQLEKLQKMHDKYKDRGFSVIGIPSNEFGGQSPESDEGVAKFCKLNYGVKFPLTKKYSVKGDSKIPLFQYLVKADKGDEIGWNFFH